MQKKILFITSDDAWGRRAANLASQYKNILVACDRSTTLFRVAKLILRKSLSIRVCIKIFIAECLRNKQNKSQPRFSEIFLSNNMILSYITANNIDTIILFRAGIIISKDIIEKVPEIFNVHCAKLDGYGGIGAIDKAIVNKAFDQQATLHRVTEKIDSGEIVDTEGYHLDETYSYVTCEDTAYKAGLILVKRTFKKFSLDCKEMSNAV